MFRPLRWIGKLISTIGESRRSLPVRAKPRRVRLHAETLEDRLAPATLTFLGNSADWFDPSNWDGGLPTSSDSVVLSGAAYLPVVNVNLATIGTGIESLTITPGFTLNITGDLTVKNLEILVLQRLLR